MSTTENTAMKLKELRLPSMAEEITLIYNGKEYTKLSALEIIDRMEDAEMISRKSNAVFKRVKQAKLTNSLPESTALITNRKEGSTAL